MLSRLTQLAQPLLLALDPERAHEMTLRALEAGLYPRSDAADASGLAVEVMGLKFANPLGIAAGFDKDARCADAILALGFGFAEVGTVTPEPQKGNPKPRVFRLIRDRAVINRLGFNNGGHIQARFRLERFRRGPRGAGIVGVNIGANRHTEDKAADYVAGLDTFYDLASYFMVNISSPNTPGLRDLQAPAALDELLGRIMARRAKFVAEGRQAVPVAVKVAPDIAEQDLPAICERLRAHNVDAIAVSNTTLARPAGLDKLFAHEAGGLSGRPLFHRSTAMLARVYRLTGGDIPLMGIGGVHSGETALAKIEAGASLVQLYTGLVYEGVGLIGRMKQELADAVRRAGVSRVQELVGRAADEWADKPLDG
jgi:dihydroorotate dehydrogenase